MTEQRLAGKVALLTGSSRRIGRAIALRLRKKERTGLGGRVAAQSRLARSTLQDRVSGRPVVRRYEVHRRQSDRQATRGVMNVEPQPLPGGFSRK
jgi:NAD(P)-dependent dehydrogenase (short-subunit alcohol dehydrogenase family)